MSGWIRIERDIFDNRLFRDKELCDFGAWCWLLTHAAWKDTTHIVHSSSVVVKRGSVIVSIRFLMREWKWGNSRILRFLKMLENQDAIKTETKTGKTLITVCNYDAYQDAEKKPRQPSSQNQDATKTRPRRDQDTKGTREPLNKVTNNKTKTLSPSVEGKNDDFIFCVDEWNSLAQKHDLPKVKMLTSARKTKLKTRLSECGGIDGWRAAMQIIGESDFLLGRVNSFKANFDFLLQQSSFAKLMEGNYSNKQSSASGVMDEIRKMKI